MLLRTDGGRALVYEIPMGDGTVYFVNTREYVGSEGVYAVYEKLLDLTVPQVLSKEDSYAKGNDDVQFAVYDQKNGQKHIYFLATDWYNESNEPRIGLLILDGKRYPVEVPFGQLVKAVSCAGKAVWPADDSCEVIRFDGSMARVQGTGKAEFYIAADGAVTSVTVDFCDGQSKQISV